QRGERIVCDLRPRCGNAGDQSRLADIGIADETRVGEKLEFKPECFFFACGAILRFMRDTVDRGNEVSVAMTAASAFGDQHALVGFGEIVKRLTGFVIVYDRSNGDFDFEVLSVAAMAVAAFAVAAPLGAKSVIEAEFQQGIVVDIRRDIDTAAVTS